MPRIFDNIDQQLLPTLKTTLCVSHRADFCVGYFNLRGWRQLDEHIDQWVGGDGQCCRLLVGMHTLPQQDIAEAYRVIQQDTELDQATALRLKKAMAEQFRNQLTFGAPTGADEAGLRRLASQIKAGKVVVKLHLRHRLHAKLYLLFRHDPVSPSIGFLGSSNLTFSGLAHQGELNVDVTDHDACAKLAQWFEDRWKDHWCLDISKEIVEIIGQSWARPDPIPPFHIYVKMAYHLSGEAREGIVQHRIPKDFRDKLFDFQIAAVKIAAHHVHKRGGVLLGDVVGLGKTLMATAVARILSDDLLLETLILCPLNLVSMWEDYCHQYRLPSYRVLSYSRVIRELPDCFHLSDTLVSNFPIPQELLTDQRLCALNKTLMEDLAKNSVKKTIATKDGDKIAYAEFSVGASKPIIDQIDTVLAAHYGFTPEELDFIINYDIKYRLGADAHEA